MALGGDYAVAMPPDESAAILNECSVELARARARLQPPQTAERLWPPLAAAALFAFCALGFAAAAILAPPVQVTPIARPGVTG